MAILSALSVVLIFLIHFPILPAAPGWNTIRRYPILLGGFVYGPVVGIVITIVVLIQALTVSASSGWVGFVMHVISTGTLVLVSSLYYKHDRSRKGVPDALILGSLAMTAIMIPTNLSSQSGFGASP